MMTRTEDSSDEWESEIMVVEINGVLDARTIRQAVATKQITLRRPETDNPLLQVLAASDKMLKTEKALMTAVAASAVQMNTDHMEKDRPPQRQCKK
ncbi:hypothetical protein RB195_006919 [Necator americanus]|uniref:Uncharacterized protein n=1 Tax=Necator americanus TaxID=51031 RepID=A0ABR1BUT9_NECAM